MKKDRDKVENMAPKKQVVPRKTQERITPRSKKFKIDYDTVENVDRTGIELLANWKCLVKEKEEAIQTSLNKLQNMQPSKRSDNRLRQEIEQHIDFQEADRHVMKRCMKNLQISIKDKLNYLRKQKIFLLDYQKILENVYNTTEKSQCIIPDPFPKFLFDVKHNHYHMFNEELLISSSERTNNYKRQMIEANTVSIGSTRIYFGRTGRTNVMTPIHENNLESDKCVIGQCVDSSCTCHRSDSELSFLNHELDIECKMYETMEESKVIENCSRQEETQRNVFQKQSQKSKIPIPVKLLPLLANKKIKYVEKSSSTPVKLPLLLPKKKTKYVEDWPSATLNLQPLLPNRKIKYMKEPSTATPKLPTLLSDKEQRCKQEKTFSNRSGTPKVIQPLKMLPQNMKKTLIVNKIRDEKKDKRKVMSTKSMSKSAAHQTAETTASKEILDISSELALERVKWKNKFRYSRLQRASGKNCYIPERKYRYSRLHKSSGKNCYIPKSKNDKVSTIVYERYCTTGKQKRNIRKQTEREKPDSYPKPDRFHTLPKNSKETLILAKIRNEKKDKSKVMSTQTMSKTAPQQTNETTASYKVSKLAPEQTDETTASNTMSESAPQQTDETIVSNTMSKSALQQTEETTAYSKMSKSAPQQTNEKTASNAMSKSAPEETDETTTSNKMSKSELYQTAETTTSNTMSELAPQTDETTASNKRSKSAPEQTAEASASNAMSKSAPQQTDETTASNKRSKSAPEETDETTASNKMSKSASHQTADTTTSNTMSESAPEQTDETTDSNTMSKSALQQTEETTASIKMSKSAPQQTDETIAWNTISKSALRQTEETTASTEILNMSSEYHTMLDIEVADKYPKDDIFHKLDDVEIIGFYQVQETNLFPIIKNMSDIKVIELYEKLYDQHIAVIKSIDSTVDDTQSSSSGSTIDDSQDAKENDGTLKTTIKTFVKKLIPDCLTNSNQCQPTETLSSNWQFLKIRSGTDIKTQYIPKPPKTPKPKTSSSRRNRYRRKNDEK